MTDTLRSNRRRAGLRAVLCATTASLAFTAAGCGLPLEDGAPDPSIEEITATVAPADNVYVHYYLWWTTTHWQQKLGSSYPFGAHPLPAPGAMDSTGCNPRVHYAGATVVDIPTEGLYDQDDATVLDHHIATAAAAGIHGFLASWQGTGTASQSPASSGYNARLDLLVQRVDAYNTAHGAHFGLGLAFASFGDYARPASEVVNDLSYFATRYGHDAAFHNAYSSRPLVMWLDGRKYALATVRTVSAAERPRMVLLGDETTTSWARDAAYLDGTSYYWSSQNPWANPAGAGQVASLADQVRAAGKLWFPSFIAGYDKQLLGGQCVPRDGVRTLDEVWRVNGATQPNGWFGVSWNEFVENTYLEPSVNYGSTYLTELSRLIHL